jgi:ribosomal protein S18 acetylase RimI-like enzyme
MTDPAATGVAATEVVELRPEHGEALLRFFRALPESDRTFIKEDVTDPETVRSWSGADEGGGRWIAVQRDGDGIAVTGYVAVRRLPGWSDHVGEVRLVVSPEHRGQGIGRDLARHALSQAVPWGLSKLVVEVVAEQQSALALFTDLGFTGEALLRDQIRDRSGRLRDLMVLAHHVGETWSGMATVGLDETLTEEPG